MIRALAFLIALLAVPAAAGEAAFDPKPWLQDLDQVHDALAAKYANLEWAVFEREADFPKLFASKSKHPPNRTGGSPMPAENLLDTEAGSPPFAAAIPMTPVPRLLLRPAEAALALGISARLLWSKTRQGEIPCLRFGKAVRYSPAALQRYIDRACGE